eukprot:8746707-Ditylum_brightwellii.AAC.1
MNWDRECGEMRFLVFRKPNQALKYVDRESTHRPTTFKSIASGVFTRLARLTLNIAANGKAQINEVYPEHAEALFMADLQESWQEDKRQKIKPIKSKQSKQDQCLVYFVIGHSNFLS